MNNQVLTGNEDRQDKHDFLALSDSIRQFAHAYSFLFIRISGTIGSEIALLLFCLIVCLLIDYDIQFGCRTSAVLKSILLRNEGICFEANDSSEQTVSKCLD
jgi:hypothetical protein